MTEEEKTSWKRRRRRRRNHNEIRLWRSLEAKETRENWDLNVTGTWVEGRDRRCFHSSYVLSPVCARNIRHKKNIIFHPKKRNLASFSEHPLSRHRKDCSRCIKQRGRRRRKLRLGILRRWLFLCTGDNCLNLIEGCGSEAFGLANGADKNCSSDVVIFLNEHDKKSREGCQNPNFSRRPR